MSSSLEAAKTEALEIFRDQQANRHRLKATSAYERIQKLNRLQRAMEQRFDELEKAVHADLRKSEAEVLLTEVYPVTSEIKHARRHLKKWMRPRRVSAPMAYLGSRSHIRYEPKGGVLILSPWNYPSTLSIGPLVSAIAAGNCAIAAKKSERLDAFRHVRKPLCDGPRPTAPLQGV